MLQLNANELTGPLPEDLLRFTERGSDRIEIQLSDNKLGGAIPGAWADRFDELILDLTGNLIISIDNSLCQKEDWMDGTVGDYHCDAILCPIGTYNEFGRRTDEASICRECTSRTISVLGSKECEGQDLNDEIALLKELYFATGGATWANNTGWTTSPDACSWHGVGCNQLGNVETIDLTGNGLTGPPPSSIFKLPDLRELDLHNNQIDFSFEGIGQATSLRVLNIANTDLDTLEGVGQAKSLLALHVTDNDLTGSIPAALFGLSNLKELYLNFNSFSGRIPADITRLSNLEQLYLFHNKLSGQIPASIGSLVTLKHLVLSGNAFTGTLPDELNDLTALEVLAIEKEGTTSNTTAGDAEEVADRSGYTHSGTGIRGPLLSFSKLTNLKSLSLGENSLTGTIPYDFLDGIADKTDTLEVALVANQLVGTIPAALTQFDRLNLFLAGNRITGIADGVCKQSNWLEGQVGLYGCDAILCPPGEVARYGRQFDTNSKCTACSDGKAAPYFGSYECIDAAEQQANEERDILIELFKETVGISWKVNTNWLYTGTSICSWQGITCVSESEESVSAIHLQGNRLVGKIPTDIFRLPNLQEINFSDNDSIDFAFTGIGNAEKLEYLKLDGIGLSSLAGLEAAANLKNIYVGKNDFKGVFPSEILSLSNLEVLDISDNLFPNGLSNQLVTLSNLHVLACSDCGLSGSFPSWIAGLPSLESIALQQNGLNGTLPLDLQLLLNLTNLDLADQTLRPQGGLSGPLPDFAMFSKLKYLFLTRNKFTGSIPSTFLQNVDNSEPVIVDMSWNALTGTVPAELTRITSLDIFLSNNMIGGIAEELCSTSWNGGATTKNGCDGILCKKGTFNTLGRATNDLPCDTCPSENYTMYFGSTQCGPDLDLDLLTVMFVDLGGPDWTNSDGWMIDPDVCKWYGITCSLSGESQGRVTSISLGSNNLVGTVRSEIFELPYLTALDLRDNSITLGFAGIMNAKKLETLYLSQTNITSLDGIGRAPALRALHLTNNNLSGPIPDELYGILALEKLYLNFNSFTGSLSPFIGGLGNLKELYLFHNSLTGSIPSEIGLLRNVEIIALGENKFSGNLPTTLNSMQALKILSLQREAGLSVTGEGLDGPLLAFDELPNLQELYIGGNEFDGQIPSSFISGIANKSATVAVDLSNNQLQGSIPPNLADFDDLVLYLEGNKIDEIPDSICAKDKWMDGEVGVNCDALLCPPGSFNQYGRRVSDDEKCQACGYLGSALYYGSTSCEVGNGDELDERGILFQFYSATGGDSWTNRDNWDEDGSDICMWYGVKCETIEGVETVTELELAANGLSGTVPPIIFHLPSLQVLNLHNNSVDFTFHGVEAATKLQNLHLDATKIRSLDGVGKAKALKVLHIQRNEFGGLQIPDEIYSLTNLEGLLISESGFEGTISGKIGDLVNLKVFSCLRNDISGEIPSEIGSLGKLEVLSLGENNLFGTLPSTLNQLTSLQSLSLDSFTRNNAGVSGPLPSFSGLPKIRELYIGSNSLTGTIPADFLAGVDFKDDTIDVVLKGNSLSGTLPAALSQFANLYIDVTENKIEAIDSSLCTVNGWMNGAVAEFGCNAILCPAGSFNLQGRQVSKGDVCLPCSSDDASLFFGSTSCAAVQKVEERRILEMLYTATGGDNWKQKDGWMDSEVDICDWYGISCHAGNTVESILLGSNNLAGTPPKEIFELPNLHFLWLYSNPIDFSFQGIGQAKSLISLLLDSTGLSSLEGIGYAPALVDIDVRFNDLDGTLPSEIRNLHDLQSFSCSNNRLSGAVPEFSTNRNLVTLRLGNNRFTGTAPAFETHRDMTSLDLSDNLLTGSIPISLLAAADTTDAIFIDLSSNQLTGTVPGELARFDDLTLYLRDNKLSGVNPQLCDPSSVWNGGDVAQFQCDGILCPARTYSPGRGRATQDGSSCIPCDQAEYVGSSTCGVTQSASLRPSTGFFCILSLLGLSVYMIL